MKQKKITLKTIDGFKIKAVHTTAKNKCIALWLHGITVDKDEYLNLFKDGAQFLAKNGIDSLRFDFRGHGKSSGKSTDFTISGQMIDIDAVIKYLKEAYANEQISVYLIGCSFGAPPCIFTAYMQPEIVKSIILIAPVLSYKRTFLNPETEWAREIFNPETVNKLYQTNKLFINDGFVITVQLYKEMQLICPENLVGNLSIPLTIIHGDSDSMVPYGVSKDIAERIQNINLITIKEMDHGFNDMHDEIGNSEKSQENKKRIYGIIKNLIEYVR